MSSGHRCEDLANAGFEYENIDEIEGNNAPQMQAPMPSIEDLHRVLLQRNAIISAMTDWLERHHPEVFVEGLWDAISKEIGGPLS